MVGVDTHTDQHVGVALDQFGWRLGVRSVPTTPAGFATLLAWARTFGTVEQFGVEGTGSYGAGLTRWLRARGLALIEVERPHRHDDRRGADVASPIRSMPRRPRGPCKPGRSSGSPRRAMATSK